MDIEDVDFLKRLKEANDRLEGWSDDLLLRDRMNLILSDAMLITPAMLAKIIRVQKYKLNSRIRDENKPTINPVAFPLSDIPELVREIDSSRELFWYEIDGRNYPISKTDLPQYLWFLSKNLRTPEKDKGLNVIEIKNLLPDKWRTYE